MTKEDWIRKLTSRKLWLAVTGFVAGLLIYFGKTSQQAEQVTALIMSAGSVIAYIIGEGWADAAGASTVYVCDDEEDPETHPPEVE